MKIAIAAALLAAGMAATAQAQVTIRYMRETSNSSLQITYQGGSYSGYGYGYGYGHGYGGYGYGGGYYSSAVAPGVVAGAWHPWGAGYYAGYGGGYRRGFGGYASYYAGPVRPVYAADPVPERSPANSAALALDQGRKRLRLGDYKGAVDEIRTAVVEDTAGGTAEAWFSVALSLWGDAKNADKALKAALAHGHKGGLELSLRDKKELARAQLFLGKGSGEAAAYVLFLLGQPEKLEQLAAKDAALKALLPPKQP